MVNTQEVPAAVDSTRPLEHGASLPVDDTKSQDHRASSTPPRRVVFLLPEGPHSFADAHLRRRLRPRRLAPPDVEVETAATALANANAMLQEFRRARALYAARQLSTLADQWNMHRVDYDSAYPTTVMPTSNLELDQEFVRYETASNACSSAIRRVKRCLSPLNELLENHTTHQHLSRTTEDDVVERVPNAKRQRLRDQEDKPAASEKIAPVTVPAEAFQAVNDLDAVPHRWYHVSKDKREPLEELTVVLDSDDGRDNYVMSPFEPSFSKTPELGASSPPEQVWTPIEDVPEDERCRPCRFNKRPVSPHREAKCEYRFLDLD
ncbi:hypothetical protein EC968_009511 [Mortierella alpina]|nr:hypothetical protein EC968_009511 [Mortierella alpina]